MIGFLTRYSPKYIPALLYMLQSSEYRPTEYLGWLQRTSNFHTVARRRKLDYTMKIKLLALVAFGLAFAVLATAGWLLYAGIDRMDYPLIGTGILCILILPWLLAYGLLAPLTIGHILIQGPRERRILHQARQTLRSHRGYKIAIVGSYGKTTAKEALASVLGKGKNVAATPGNMNTPLGISRFVTTLTGNEDVLIFEFGESHVGDIKELCELVEPDAGIITGISEAHLETFGTVENIVSTIFELQDYLGDKPLYKNGENELIRNKASESDPFLFDKHGVGEWKVTDILFTIHGIDGKISRGERTIQLHAGILGEHNVGILSAVVSLAAEQELTDSEIEEGLATIVPFEHRMQPRELHGAWIIDDTYNGNSEGVCAGLELLKTLPATRRIYVTPGLVEQGDKTAEIHYKIGQQIAAVADITVLMKNSVTQYMVDGLTEAGYAGELKIVEDPVAFYQHIDQFVVAGDVVLMQNDWTDNYA